MRKNRFALLLVLAVTAVGASAEPAGLGGAIDEARDRVRTMRKAVGGLLHDPDAPGPSWKTWVGGMSGLVDSRRVRFNVFSDGVEGFIGGDVMNAEFSISDGRVFCEAQDVDLIVSDSSVRGRVGRALVNLSIMGNGVTGSIGDAPVRLDLSDKRAFGRVGTSVIRFSVSSARGRSVPVSLAAALAAVGGALAR